MPVSTECGLFSWRPRILKGLNKPWLYLTLFSITSFGMAVPIGINQIVMPLLQSLFNLSTQQMAWILVSNDLSGIFFSLLLGQICSSKKMRWLGVGIIITVLSGIIQATPHLFAQLPEGEAESGNTSRNSLSEEVCRAEERHSTVSRSQFYAVENNRLYWVFVLGGLVQGIGHTPPGIAGMTYLDEIFSEKKIGLAIAAVLVITVVGFPMALIIGAGFLNIYATLKPPPGLQMGDPEWVGAWWLGYIIPAVLVAVFGLPLILFPQQPKHAMKVLKKKEEAGSTNHAEKDLEMKRSLKALILDFIPSLKRLAKNKSLMFFIFGDAMLFLFFASTPYEPKMMAIYYRMNPVKVGNIAGITRVVATIVGLGIGAFLTTSQRFKGELGRRCIQITAIASFVTIPLGFISLYYCEQDKIAGLTAPYPDSVQSLELDHKMSLECNSGCNCKTNYYTPVCDITTNTTYFSACMVGCLESSKSNNKSVTYKDCGCLSDMANVVKGSCNLGTTSNCDLRFWAYITVTAIGTACIFIIIPSINIVYLRITTEIDRSSAQGLKQFFTRILGTLPGPLIFGALIDHYCILWRNTDDSRGSCLIYNTNQLMLTYTLGQFGVRLTGSICFFLSLYYYPQSKKRYQPVEISEYNVAT